MMNISHFLVEKHLKRRLELQVFPDSMLETNDIPYRIAETLGFDVFIFGDLSYNLKTNSLFHT